MKVAREPLVGQIHAVILLQLYEHGASGAAGWLGVMPGRRKEWLVDQLFSDPYAKESVAFEI